MKIRLTIDVFSGRTNPRVELEGTEAEELLARIRPARKLEGAAAAPPPESTLGYRGLVVEQLEEARRGLPKAFRVAGGRVFGRKLAAVTEDELVDEFVCGTGGPLTRLELPPKFIPTLLKEIAASRRLWSELELIPIRWPLRPVCRCGPVYEPDWWNDAGQKQFNNNCYNYATNYRSDTYAQPGQAAGAMYAALTCASVRPAAIKDQLVDDPGADNKCPPEGHLVALVVAPGWDFHWYRKGRNGLWSHKPGGTPVTNLDNGGVIITDPRTANRGPYTDFCSFMVVHHGHIKIT